MNLKTACINILDQMSDVINQLDDEAFIAPSKSLSGSTLGQHFRHAIEFFECLMSGSESGIICYDRRDHDKTIETSRILAIDLLDRIKSFISQASVEQELTLEVSYHPDSPETEKVQSNMAREIVYNIEHVVHHMALVKIGLKELSPALSLPADFGVAVSTIKYQKSQS